MDVLIIADFCGQLNGQDNNRFIYLANLLSENNEVEIVSSDFDHTSKKYFTEIATEVPYKITLLHEGRYKKNVSLRRFAAHYTWGKSVKKYLEKREFPDVIYCAVPTLKAAYEAAKYCEKNKIRFIIDIQDLWPEAFQMVFNPPIIRNIVYAPFKRLADEVYKRADVIVAVSQTYSNRGVSVNNKECKGHTVFLGTDLAVFDKSVAEYRNSVIKKENEIWVGYCGTLGSSYDLETVVKAMSKVEFEKKIRLVVMGDGIKRKRLEKYAGELRVDATFCGLLPYAKMCGVLSQCDIVVNPIKRNAAQSIINKHADYAAAGVPVVNTQESREYRELVDKWNMGINCRNSDSDDVAEKIMQLIKNDKLREKMGNNARRCAEEVFDRGVTYRRLIHDIMKE